MKNKKLALIFPGIGYHTDKPLLYYGKKIAAAWGWEIAEVSYQNIPPGVKGSEEKMREAFERALAQAEELLREVNPKGREQVLCISKSIGTAAAAAYDQKHGLKAAHIFYTPLQETFRFAAPKSGIAFHGSSDPWASTPFIIKCCQEKEIPLYLTPNANHFLETGNVQTDLQILEKTMAQTEAYIKAL